MRVTSNRIFPFVPSHPSLNQCHSFHSPMGSDCMVYWCYRCFEQIFIRSGKIKENKKCYFTFICSFSKASFHYFNLSMWSASFSFSAKSFFHRISCEVLPLSASILVVLSGSLYSPSRLKDNLSIGFEANVFSFYTSNILLYSLFAS